MSEASAQKAVLAVIIATAAVVTWDNIKKTRRKATPTGKGLVAFTILAAGLSIGAGVAPSIVGPFAILIGLAIVVSRISPTTTQNIPYLGKH